MQEMQCSKFQKNTKSDKKILAKNIGNSNLLLNRCPIINSPNIEEFNLL